MKKKEKLKKTERLNPRSQIKIKLLEPLRGFKTKGGFNPSNRQDGGGVTFCTVWWDTPAPTPGGLTDTDWEEVYDTGGTGLQDLGDCDILV